MHHLFYVHYVEKKERKKETFTFYNRLKDNDDNYW